MAPAVAVVRGRVAAHPARRRRAGRTSGGRRHHGVPGSACAALHHRRSRREPVVHRDERNDDRPYLDRGGGHGVPICRPRARSLRSSRKVRMATCGSRRGSGNMIGRVTPSGTVTEFADPNRQQLPRRDRHGPGREPVVHRDGSHHHRADHPFGDVTEFPGADIRRVQHHRRSGREHVVRSGPTRGSEIGQITTSGVVSGFPIPAGGGAHTIATGPDGNLWFTEWCCDRIARMTTSGSVTEFTLPALGSAAPAGDRSGSGREPVVHRDPGQPCRSDDDGRNDHGVHRADDPGRQRADRHGSGIRRQHVVHGTTAQAGSGGSRSPLRSSSPARRYRRSHRSRGVWRTSVTIVGTTSSAPTRSRSTVWRSRRSRWTRREP